MGTTVRGAGVMTGDRKRTIRPPGERFWARVAKGPGCWLWQGATNKDGYGVFGISKRDHVLAHRFAYENVVGEIPAGLILLHRCDTPACVRPDHLSPGTQADNVADSILKGRSHRPATVCINGHPQVGSNVSYQGRIKRHRVCLVCHRERARSRRARA